MGGVGGEVGGQVPAPHLPRIKSALLTRRSKVPLSHRPSERLHVTMPNAQGAFAKKVESAACKTKGEELLFIFRASFSTHSL